MTTESVPAAARVRQNQDDGVDEVIPGAATTFVVLKMADYEALLKGEPVADDVGNERFVMMANFGQGELMAVKDLYSEVPKKKKPDYVKRPLNAFFIWAKHEREQIKVMQQTCKIQSIDVSRHLGEKWKTMSDDEKAPWYELAELEKQDHKSRNPGYKFQPLRGTSGSASTDRSRKVSKPQVDGLENLSICLTPTDVEEPEELQYKIRHSLRQAKGVIIRQQYAWML
eukprot:Colp12_sorted_trinity150504_noHs@8006